MESRCASAIQPLPGSDPAQGLLVRSREVAAPAGRTRGRVAAMVISGGLHLVAAGLLLLGGGPVPVGQSDLPVSADTGRVQLRFVSAHAPAATSAADDVPAAGASSSPGASGQENTPPATAHPASPPLTSRSSAVRVMDEHARDSEANEMPWQSSGMPGPSPAETSPDNATGVQTAAQTQGHRYGHGDQSRSDAAQGPGDRQTTGPATGVTVAGSEADWAESVMRRLEKFRVYPAAARHRRVEGVVMVQATIGADGKVLETRLRSSCGNADLDAEALATFARARKVPAPPSHLPIPVRVDLPVAFALRS